MPSELDFQLHAIMDRLTAPGGQFETVPVTRAGQTYPAFVHAPPTLAGLYAFSVAQYGDAPFLVDGEVRLTFRETHALALRLASGLLAAHRIERGARVGIAARNSANWIIAYMAVTLAGGCATLLNGWWNGTELAEGIALAGCRLVLADAERARRLDGFDHGSELVVFGHGDAAGGFGPLLAGEAGPLPELTGEDLATILFTSGSTGTAKGAWSEHRAVVHGAMSYAAQSLMVLTQMTGAGKAPQGQPCALVNVPLFHVTGEVPVFLQSFLIGRKLVIMPKWDAREAMRLIEAERVSYFVGVPLMSYEIATHPERDRFDLTSCFSFVAGGAPRPVEHVGRIREALPHGFPLIGYGLTETNAVGCANFNENYLAKPNSTGPASRPIVELAILGNDGERLSQGEMGEIAIRSIANFGGYWNNPEATAAALRPDGFFLTGDLGYCDEDGYLFIVDRKKDIIIRGGENIACIEVEQALYAHDSVAEACVFGLADARYGEVPAAVFLAKEGHDLDEESLLAFVATRIAAFKVPARIWRHDEPLPRLGTEKIDRRVLRARYAAEGTGAKTQA
jgi:long-chain acyl-CoA synthetase